MSKQPETNAAKLNELLNQLKDIRSRQNHRHNNCPLEGTLIRDAELKASPDGKPYLHIDGLRMGSAEAAKKVRTAFLDMADIDVGESDGTEAIIIAVVDPDAIATAEKFVTGAKVFLQGKLGGNDRGGFTFTARVCRLRQDITSQEINTYFELMLGRLQ